MKRGKCGEDLTWTLDDYGTLTISGNGVMDDYSAPEESPWFNQRNRIKKVVINSCVISIGKCAFWDCKYLTSITIPDSVTSIGKMVCSWCDKLKKIYYPEGSGFERILSQGNNAELIPYVAEKLRWKVESKTLRVGGVREIKFFSEPPWFDNVPDIQAIIIEEGVEKISANAFIDCRRLELLTIPASVKTIGDLTFTACYCGNKLANGGKNVFWCLEDGVLILKKNPAAKSTSDFSTGSVSRLAKCGNAGQVSFA